MHVKPFNLDLRLQTILLISFLLCLIPTSQAQEYGFDVCTTANGLPQNTVTGVAQTPDGYLWLSTFDGLARFDGARFTIFDKGNTKGIVNNRFATLVADREGAVYAVTEDNVVTVYRQGGFDSYSQFATSGEAVSLTVVDINGSVVVETDKGYYSLQGNRFVHTPDQKEANVKQIYLGKSGAKWVIGRERTTRNMDGQVTTYPLRLTVEELSSSISLDQGESRK